MPQLRAAIHRSTGRNSSFPTFKAVADCAHGPFFPARFPARFCRQFRHGRPDHRHGGFRLRRSWGRRIRRAHRTSGPHLGTAPGGDPSTAPSSSAAAAVASDNPLIAVRRPPSGGVYRSLSYNPAESAALLTYDDAEGGGYELYPVPRDSGSAAGGGGGRGGNASSSSDPAPEPRRGAGAGAVFVARNRFAVLDRGANLLAIKNLRNETTKAVPSPLAVTDAVFYAGTGRLLLRGSGSSVSNSDGSSSTAAAAAAAPSSISPGDRVVLFDVQQRAVIAEVACPGGEECFEFFLSIFFSRSEVEVEVGSPQKKDEKKLTFLCLPFLILKKTNKNNSRRHVRRLVPGRRPRRAALQARRRACR